uniref:Efflux RND transporter permease subunit n=1 Tax=Roseihalotalea indica TaxID=2867963 RepID=A0AA49GRW5_9BACT|nr:efflux RND transporter permease subunit [Tunicatimonas sp. TK19036]
MASLSSLSVQRPVLAIVMSILIITFGVIGYTFLGVREYPSVDPPVISVSTSYTGANADVIESQITEPLEDAINAVAGIKSLTSVSRDGRSTITAEFDLDVDLETAANDIRDKVSGAVDNLPQDADPPSVQKADADRSPIVGITVSSDSRSLLEVSNIAMTTFKERLQTIPDVSEVAIYGEKQYSMRLWMDADKLAAYGITPLEVLNAVREENVELPSGRVEGLNTELTVRTMGRLSTPDDFNNLVIKRSGDNVVKFQDIGNAELGAENERTMFKRNGISMVGVVVRPQPGANYIDIADAFYERLEFIKKDLPEDIKIGEFFDDSEYIRKSIHEVRDTIIQAFVLVAFIIFLFLRDWRTTVIPVITIPISLIGTFFVMFLLGFSVNVLTLLGIVLAIGLVVDDTIVVLENIYAKIERGVEPVRASLDGAKEIFFAVISTTVALVAVFLPVVFLQGLTGRLFREFGLVIAAAVVISSFVALTLAPMLCSRILKRRERNTWLYRNTEPFFVWLNRGYNRSLASFMRYRWLAFVVVVFSGGMIWLLLKYIPSEVAPLEDRGMVRMSVTGPEGATFEYMDAYIDRLNVVVEEELADDEVRSLIMITSPGFGSTSSVNSGYVRISLTDREKRTRSQQEIVDALIPKVSQMTQARTNVTQEPTINNRRQGLPVQYVIQAPTLDKLEEVLPKFMDMANQNPAFSFVDLNLKFNKPEIEVTIDRAKARNLGVSVQDISQTLQLGLSGSRFDYFIMGGKQYQVIGQVKRSDRDDPLDLRSLYVKSENGELIQLDNLVFLKEQSTPPQLFRFNRYSAATVSADLAPGYTLDEGIDAMDQIASQVLDDSFATDLEGQSAEFRESSGSLLFAFMFAILLIYLVLSAQFESFRDPSVIMFTVPLALAGALLAIWYFNETLNIFSQIGIIMLIGLVTKNGILIVEFANQRKAQGKSLQEAIVEAAESRFRPILMTSLSTILGILPIALALGAGSESRVSMGIAVIGGLIFSTVLTLYVIPAMYMYISSGQEHRVART